MSPDPSVQIVETLVWDGRTLEVRYEPDWCSLSELGPDRQLAHLELQVLDPPSAPLPVTETGYLSHFVRVGVVEAAGGPAFRRSPIISTSGHGSLPRKAISVGLNRSMGACCACSHSFGTPRLPYDIPHFPLAARRVPGSGRCRHEPDTTVARFMRVLCSADLLACLRLRGRVTWR